MPLRSSGRNDKLAAEALRRLVAAHESGRITTAAYRERRRRLLDAVTRGHRLPRDEPPARPRVHLVWWLAGAALTLIALGLWLNS